MSNADLSPNETREVFFKIFSADLETMVISKFSEADRSEFFQVITDHSRILSKILPQFTILKFINGQIKPLDTPFFKAYLDWKERNA